MMQLVARDRHESVKGSRSYLLYDRVAGAVDSHFYSENQIAVVNAVRALYTQASLEMADVTDRGGSGVFQGDHVLLQDGGAWYPWFVARARETETDAAMSRRRTSSHQDTFVPQWEIPLPGLGCILVGKRSGHTWFQNEAHGLTDSYWDRILHGWDWIRHRAAANRQIGALGSSGHSEKRGSHLIVPWESSERMLLQIVKTYP